MAQKESHNQSERTQKLPLPNLVSAEFAVMGKKRVEEFVNAQNELLDNLQEINHQWLERMQLEVSVASEVASKLTAIRSIPPSCCNGRKWPR